ncbi:sugar ABC transporter substrate-binding protein [Amycolatopsis sp. WAC 01375]|uniref:ABC transporter substrate-binding protein n=1 Tax=unclassified Amycolatopsis TaxID=2618356 RepID=UPI000F77883D|nr:MULTISPECIES: extracellular solute-binding protein [unclassified Amycolatopsis]RSM79951.1 sugar ABC transporter substrate-binding protein [Amycolatopsis sp. WAC 01375]RSN27355.1 sugar ABC transporter substrate-binding protein [Amycolatopsis sp. WAC 01416]
MSSTWSPTVRRRMFCLLLAGGLTLGVAACGSGSGETTGAGGKVKITVTGQPPASQPFERGVFDADVKEFEETHPDIDIEPHEGFMDPKTFSAKLAGGQLEDVYYVYFTDPAQIIARRQAADITEAAKGLKNFGDIKPELLDNFRGADGKLYGLPTMNYSMGLVYSRPLFRKAGLDPNKPPQTWDEVREAAKKIAALGNGTVGYADYSKNNQGGWHLTGWLYSMGSEVARKEGDKWVAAFNNDKAKAALNQLRAMRWDDDSMGAKQLLEAQDVQRMMGAGQLGMYMAAPDNVPVLVKQFNGKYEDYGVAGMPGGQGTLLGGEGYMINPKASPEKIKAGLEWVRWKYLNPDRFEKHVQQYVDGKQPVGLPAEPTPDVWQGAVRDQQLAIKAKHANVPAENYQSYVDASSRIKGSIEPPNAQQVYAVLDSVMQAVLTDRSANIDQQLSSAESKVNSVLAQVK